MASNPIEERLTPLENEVAYLKKHLSLLTLQPDWFDKILGSFQDDPEFEEIIRLGREIREADQPSDSEEA
jgi:hypothetical protein